MRSCDSCGINYAEHRVVIDRNDPDNEDDQGLYCSVCFHKQQEDGKIKKWLKDVNKKVQSATVEELLEKTGVNTKYINDKNLWERILFYLNRECYDF